MTVQNTPNTQISSRAVFRYTDSYRVAAIIILLGNIVQFVGIAIGLVIGVGGTVAAMNMFRRFQTVERNVTIGASIVVGLLVVAVFFIISVLVRSQGQVLRASLDGAVHSSPFLSDNEKASAMGL